MAKVSEARTQIYLPREQHRELQRVARERDTSMAQVVREAVDAYLAHLTGPAVLDDETFRNDPIWSLPDRARDFGRDDAARDHDTLLYESVSMPDRGGREVGPEDSKDSSTAG